MALTAIKVHEDVFPVFKDFQLKHCYRYILFTFDAKNENIIVDKCAPKEATYEDFLDELPQKDFRYALYDFDFTADDGTKRNKIVFVNWVPDTAPIKRKMLAASTKATLKNALGISIELQATDDSEISEAAMLQKVKSYIQ